MVFFVGGFDIKFKMITYVPFFSVFSSGETLKVRYNKLMLLTYPCYVITSEFTVVTLVSIFYIHNLIILYIFLNIIKMKCK